MAYLVLYGNGWSQRWRVAPGMEEHVRSQISQVGTDGSGQLPVMDPGSDVETTLVVAWGQVATAVVLDSVVEAGREASAGQYA